jgi:hypothetical protein
MKPLVTCISGMGRNSGARFAPEVTFFTFVLFARRSWQLV